MKVMTPRQLRNHVRKVAQNASRIMAEEVHFRIEQHYERVIELFYQDYKPRRYKRTYSTYLASSGYRDPNTGSLAALSGNIKQVGKYWQSGIRVSGANIPGNPYYSISTHKPYDKMKVFENTFVRGMHGGQGFIDMYDFDYSRAVGRRMKRAPKDMMDAWFAKFSKQKNPELLQIGEEAYLKALKITK